MSRREILASVYVAQKKCLENMFSINDFLVRKVIYFGRIDSMKIRVCVFRLFTLIEKPVEAGEDK